MLARLMFCVAVLAALLVPLPDAAAATGQPPDSAASATDANGAPSAGTAAKPPASSPSSTTSKDQNSNPYGPALRVLFELFALAVVLESGLAVIFNWRPFLELFDSRGVKTVASVVAALVLVNAFTLDLTTDLVRVFEPGVPSAGALGSFLTALVLAGGSSGVNSIMVALGFRSMRSAEAVTPKPPPTKAWISVRVEERRDAAASALPGAEGPLQVLLSVDGAEPAIIGAIDGRSPPNPYVRYFMRDRGRYPRAGGFSLEPGKKYRVVLADAKGTPIPNLEWGPQPVAAGAIVDIEFKVRLA